MAELYFAYGSNMSSRRLMERISPLRVRGPARLPDHGLVYNKPGRDGSGKANVVSRAGAVCWGVVWEITRGDWPALDRFEPGYHRERGRVLDAYECSIPVQIYRYQRPGPEIAPLDWYVEHLLEGAREHGLPPDYASTLRRTYAES